jgi:hypothetical protein
LKHEADAVNQNVGKTFGELFSMTMEKFAILAGSGYRVVFRWEGSTWDELFVPKGEYDANMP